VIILCTFVVTVGTLMVQGLTLPGLIRLLGISSTDEDTDTLAEAQVKYHAAKAPAARWQRLRLTMLAAEREVFIAARDERQIDDEVFRRVQRELDLEEAALIRE
jgi:CPA1 family monovalent cation:H+ antiporter